MASDYCFEIEAMAALKRHRENKAVVIPIILRPVNWPSGPFGNIQALPRNGKPITTYEDLDVAFLEVETGIRKALNDRLLSICDGKGSPSADISRLGNGGANDRISGEWVGVGRERFVADGEAGIDFTIEATFVIEGNDWSSVSIIHTEPNSTYPSEPSSFEVVAKGYLNAYGWANLQYNNQLSAVPNHGVMYVRYDGLPERLHGHYAGFSGLRRTLVAGDLELRRKPPI